MKLSVLCEQDRILQDLEDKIRALKENKVNMGEVALVLRLCTSVALLVIDVKF